MISRFFKRKGEGKKVVKEEEEGPKRSFKKLLTAEGWKRMMMRRSTKEKK